MTSLPAFFETMWPFLEGRSTVDDVVARLGPSPSGNARLALYPVLVARQRKSVLDRFFASVRAACDAHEAGIWERISADLLRWKSPRHWEPNHYAEAMLELLRQYEDERATPSSWRELADFAWIRFLAMNAEHDTAATSPLLGQAVFVRRYDHEIPRYALSAEAGTLLPGASPDPTPATVLIARSRQTARLEIVRPSVAALIALGRRVGSPAPLPPGLSEADIDAEDEALTKLGILAPRGPEVAR